MRDMSAVFNACSMGDWALAETLFDQDPQSALEYRDRQGWSILHEAANRNAPLNFVKKMLAYGLSPNEKNAVQRTPLHYAMQQQSSIDLIDLLLTVGGNPNIEDKLGKTPLHWAVLENVSISVVKLAIIAGGDLNRADKDGKTAIHTAVENKVQPEILDDIIRLGGDPNRLDKEGATPLYTAVFVEAPPSLVSVLLRHGAKMETMRLRVARYHGSELLCLQIEKARNLIAIMSAGMIKRIGLRSYIRVLPVELIRCLSDLLYPKFGDHLVNSVAEDRIDDDFQVDDHNVLGN